MKDVRQLLTESSGPKPRRQLPRDFTSGVIKTIVDTPRPQKSSRWRRTWLVARLLVLPKSVLACLAVAVVLCFGSSAYATVSTLQKDQQVGEISKVFGVNRKSCQPIRDVISNATEADTAYFEVKQGHLKEWMLQTVLTRCNDVHAENVSKLLFADSQKNASISTVGLIIRDIQSQSLTLGYDLAWQGRAGLSDFYGKDYTYRRLDPQLAVYENDKIIPYSALRVGDSVRVMWRFDAPPGDYSEEHNKMGSLWSDVNRLVVVGIIKSPSPSASMIDFRLQYDKLFWPVQACVSSNAGFCRSNPRAEPMVRNAWVYEGI